MFELLKILKQDFCSGPQVPYVSFLVQMVSFSQIKEMLDSLKKKVKHSFNKTNQNVYYLRNKTLCCSAMQYQKYIKQKQQQN